MIRLRRLTPTICAFHLGFSLAAAIPLIVETVRTSGRITEHLTGPPFCETQAGGLVPALTLTTPDIENIASTVARILNAPSGLDAVINQGLSLHPGNHRPVTVTPVQPDQDGNTNNGFRFVLEGFRANPAQLRAIIDTEIAPALSYLTKQTGASHYTKELWLQIRTHGRDTVSQSHMRDMPGATLDRLLIRTTHDFRGDCRKVLPIGSLSFG